MGDEDDEQLLRKYVEAGSDAAFATLVARHANLVWSAASRLCDGDPHAAEDVAQSVFAALAAKAPRLKKGVVLAGWLLTATRYAAADQRKADRRRKVHERRAAAMPNRANPDATAAAASDVESAECWERVAPLLDKALSRLSEPLRLAVVLRFFERKSMRDVAVRLGITEEAARQRVARGLGKLRGALGRNSVVLPAVALGSLLAGRAVEAAPVGAASTFASAARAAVTTHGLAHAGVVPRWLLGWAKASAATCVFGGLIVGAAALVAWELRGAPRRETVRLAQPASTEAATTGVRLALPPVRLLSRDGANEPGNQKFQVHFDKPGATGLQISPSPSPSPSPSADQ